MIKLNKKFMVIPTKNVISYLLFNRASLDFIKTSNCWIYQSDKNRLKFITPRSASRLLRVMKEL